MREIHELLNRRWVIKKADPDMYFRLKDKHASYKEFFREKLGYNIIINPLLIKAEKIPGIAEGWMGIKAFDSELAYVFLCYVLMFLEEMDPEEQFVLSQVTDYIKNQYQGDEDIDWTVFTQRKTLIKVLRFCAEEQMILVNDGDENRFSSSERAMEVLYENTGTSKYFMRRFPFDISEIKSGEDLVQLEWQMEERDRGVIRRHRVYRRLLMSPAVYDLGDNDQDYLYIKNQRSVIENDMEKYLDAAFHLHRNGAFLLLHNKMDISDSLPNRRNISDIILQMNKLIGNQVSQGSYNRDLRDRIELAKLEWESLVQELISVYRDGWGKTYREKSFSQLNEELIREMDDFGMIQIKPPYNDVYIMPACGKITGDYSKDYWKQLEDRNERVED